MWRPASTSSQNGSIPTRQIIRSDVKKGLDPSLYSPAARNNWTSSGGGLIFVQPTDKDILSGRGRAPLKNPGNVKFFAAVQENLETYIAAPRRPDKSVVVADIVGRLQATGARFLKLDENSKRYYVLRDDQARCKTGHAIRDLLRSRDEAKSTKVVQSSATASNKKKTKKKTSVVKKNASRRLGSCQRLGKSVVPRPGSQTSSSSGPPSDHKIVLLGERGGGTEVQTSPRSKRSCSARLGLVSTSMSLKHLSGKVVSIKVTGTNPEIVTFEPASVAGGENDGCLDDGLSDTLDRLSYFDALDDDDEPCLPSIFDMDLVSKSADSVMSSLEDNASSLNGAFTIQNVLRSSIEDDGEDLWYPRKTSTTRVSETPRMSAINALSFPSAFSSWDFSIDEL